MSLTVAEIKRLPANPALRLLRLDDDPRRPPSSTLLAAAIVANTNTGRRLSLELRFVTPVTFAVTALFVSRPNDWAATTRSRLSAVTMQTIGTG